MSKINIWGIDKDLNGKIVETIEDNRIFYPVIREVLFEKYYPKNEVYNISRKEDDKRYDLMNYIMCHIADLTDRVCWELINNKIFKCRNKDDVGITLSNFLWKNKEYILKQEYINESYEEYKYEQIKEAWENIEETISGHAEDNGNYLLYIEPTIFVDCDYFMFDVDPINSGIEDWFNENKLIKTEYVTDVIEFYHNGCITKITPNTDLISE